MNDEQKNIVLKDLLVSLNRKLYMLDTLSVLS